MNEDYTLEKLIDIFKEHDDQLTRGDFHKEGDFRLPLALLTICKEISNIKNFLNK